MDADEAVRPRFRIPGILQPTSLWSRIMPMSVATGAPTLFIRRAAYEASGLSRAAVDERLGLTPDEFRVEEDLVAIGPIYAGSGDAITDFIAELESAGLVYFDDFFELSGNWPVWLRLRASSR
jgi:hypothetical protein